MIARVSLEILYDKNLRPESYDKHTDSGHCQQAQRGDEAKRSLRGCEALGQLPLCRRAGEHRGFPCDLLIIDDPYKDHLEAHSLIVRENVWNNFVSVLLPRLQEGRGVLICSSR